MTVTTKTMPWKRKPRFRFSGRAGGRYYWQSELPIAPGDSRYEQVSCSVAWFWGWQR